MMCMLALYAFEVHTCIMELEMYILHHQPSCWLFCMRVKDFDSVRHNMQWYNNCKFKGKVVFKSDTPGEPAKGIPYTFNIQW